MRFFLGNVFHLEIYWKRAGSTAYILCCLHCRCMLSSLLLLPFHPTYMVLWFSKSGTNRGWLGPWHAVAFPSAHRSVNIVWWMPVYMCVQENWFIQWSMLSFVLPAFAERRLKVFGLLGGFPSLQYECWLLKLMFISNSMFIILG